MSAKKTSHPARAGLAALLVACACHAAAGAPQQVSMQEQLAVGTWYGEFSGGADKPLQRFLMTRNADGSFTLTARMYERGKLSAELVNTGLWGVSNGMYFTYTTRVNAADTDRKDPAVVNPYLIRKLTDSEFVYQHIPSGNEFRVIRVNPATARLPD